MAADAPAGASPPAGDVVALALDLLRTAPYGFLVTHPVSAGAPHARLVQHVDVTDEMVLRVGTSPRSRKVDELVVSPRAAYAVEERSRFAAVVAEGTAQVLDEVELRRAVWDPGFVAFFPDGPEGDDFVVVELRADRLKLLDFSLGLAPPPYGLVPAVAVRSADGWTSEDPARRS